MGSPLSDRYYIHLPVWTGGNIFLGGARPWEKESDYTEVVDTNIDIAVEQKEDGWFLSTNLYEYLPEKQGKTINTQILGMAFEPEQRFENPDGTEITFDEIPPVPLQTAWKQPEDCSELRKQQENRNCHLRSVRPKMAANRKISRRK